MRTAQICPTCATYTNAVCVIYDGIYLSNINVSPGDDLETILASVDSTIDVMLASFQPLLGFTPEDVANKSTSVIIDQASNTKYPSVKAVFDWVVANFTPVLGFTPENVANKSTNIVTDQASNTKYPSVKAVFDWATATFQPVLGFTPENVANKSTDNTLGGLTPSNTLYPTQKAVKDFVTSYVGTVPTLQQVTTSGNVTSDNIIVRAAAGGYMGVQNLSSNTKAYLSYFSNNGFLGILNVFGNELNLKATNLTANRDLEAPDKSGTIATTDDLVFYRNVVFLSSSDIANMDTVQVIGVPAPPAGKAIVVNNISVRTYSGTGWTTSNNILLRPVGGSNGICATQQSPLSLADNVTSENVLTGWWPNTPSAVALEFRGSQGVPPSGGTLAATVYITYQLITL